MTFVFKVKLINNHLSIINYKNYEFIQRISTLQRQSGKSSRFFSLGRKWTAIPRFLWRSRCDFHWSQSSALCRKIEKSIGEIGLDDKELETLADLTGEKHNNGLAFSFSDIRLRVLPEAVSKCFPSKALDFESVKETIIQLNPSPKII